jgi:hypothetical protein
MGETESAEKKKGGFFRKLFKLTAIVAAIAGALMFWKRRKGEDLDDVEWQELPPPDGG